MMLLVPFVATFVCVLLMAGLLDPADSDFVTEVVDTDLTFVPAGTHVTGLYDQGSDA